MADVSDLAKQMARKAMLEGSNLALDGAIRVVGKLVEGFTVKGCPQEAAGAMAAMELLKQFRADQVSIYSPSEG